MINSIAAEYDPQRFQTSHRFSSIKSVIFWLMIILNILLSARLFVVSHDLPMIATVDISGLIKGYVQDQAKLHLSPAVAKEQAKHFGQQLETVMKHLARTRHLVILPQEAVLIGGKDLTQEVKESLNLTSTAKGNLW